VGSASPNHRLKEQPDLPPTLLYLGDLDDRHGVDLLLRAMPILLRHHPESRLVVIGDGPLAEPLAAYARYLQLEEVVSFLPARPMPYHADAIHSADVVVIPGRQAVSPDAIQAAWWAQKPVVATHEAASAFAEHERDALLVYPSENAIAAAVVRLLDDPSLARKLGEMGHRRFLDGFPAGHGVP
jgi:phosphatidyl-myo-inositol dimannoside synthase